MERHTKNDYYIVLGYLLPILEYLRKQGLPLKPYLQIMNLQDRDLKDVDRRLPESVLCDLLDCAAQELNDPNIGLHIGQVTQPHNLGIVGMLAMHCNQASELFELQTRYQSLVGNTLVSRYEAEGSQMSLITEIKCSERKRHRHSTEYSLATWFSLKDMLIGREFGPLKVELPYMRPENDLELTALFHDAAIAYGQATLKITFDRRLADLELLVSDPQLKKVLELQANQRLRQLQGEQEHDDPVIAEIRQLIMDQLPYGPPAIEAIADKLGVSVRKLQRMLSHQKLSYTAVVDQLRSELAKRHVEDRDLSLIDVAMMLGFSEQSSFSRAYKRWYGESPVGHRKLHGLVS